MTAEQFKELGISEELAKKAADKSKEELAGYIPKHKFEEVSEENKKLKKDAEETEKTLKELKESTGDAASLKEQIETLQKAAKEAKETHEKEMGELKMSNAIKLAISGKVHDEELVAGLFDKSKLLLGEDGKITGLEEQLKTLQESKKFLFKEDADGKTGEGGNAGQQGSGFVKVGADKQQEGSESKALSLKEAIESHYQAANKA